MVIIFFKTQLSLITILYLLSCLIKADAFYQRRNPSEFRFKLPADFDPNNPYKASSNIKINMPLRDTISTIDMTQSIYLNDVFRFLDYNNDGKITPEEMGRLCSVKGINCQSNLCLKDQLWCRERITYG